MPKSCANSRHGTFAERAGSATIWPARLRMAGDLEREAHRLSARVA
jgi:hypothetical protein